MSTNVPSKDPPKKVALPQGVCVAIAKKLIKVHTNILDENTALDLIDEVINTREKLETFYRLGIESDDKYFIEQSSRLSIMYMILGESLGTSSPEVIKSNLVGYSNTSPQVLERMSRCIKDARTIFRNLQ